MLKTHQEELFYNNHSRISTIDSESFQLDRRNAEIILLKEFRRLSGTQQEVLVLRLIKKRSYKEIKEITGIGKDTAARMVFDGLKELAQKILRDP